MKEVTLINQKIKEILKQKKFTYKKLANELEMSESGVKKLLSGRDYSLSRLIQICNILQVKFEHILSGLEDKEEVVSVLAEGHEEFFLKNWDYFCFYWVKVFEGWPLKTILERYDLSLERAQMYLRKLDEMNLLEYHSDDKILYPDASNIRFEGVNRLEKKIFEQWPDRLVKETRETWNKEKDPSYIVCWSKMSHATYVEFKNELTKLIKAYQNRGNYDNSVGKPNIMMTRFCFAMNSGSFVTYGDI